MKFRYVPGWEHGNPRIEEVLYIIRVFALPPAVEDGCRRHSPGEPVVSLISAR